MKLILIYFGALIYLLSSAPALAYLDPGTGTIIVQALIGMVAGGLVAIRVYWHRIKSFLNRSASKPETDQDN